MSDQTNPKDMLGAKKPPLHLVAPVLRIWVSKVFEFSARKYGPYNWREKKVRKSIYLDAICRHTDAMIDGEWVDPETGIPHAAHVGANVAILLDAAEQGNLIDDMPWRPGPAPGLLKKLDESKKKGG